VNEAISSKKVEKYISLIHDSLTYAVGLSVNSKKCLVFDFVEFLLEFSRTKLFKIQYLPP
jgi:hypothetical protein